MDRVKTVRMGGNLLISGADKAVVEAALAAQVEQGAKVVSPVHQLGVRWMATCEDLSDPVQRCELIRMGAQMMVKGPSRDAVRGKLEELLAKGGKVTSDPRENSGVWVAVYQPGGKADAYDRW